jgi:hypothetical protein
MQSVDVNQSKNNIDSKIKSIKTYVDLSKSEKQASRDTQNSFQKSVSDVATQLNKITEEQKRFQRNVNDKMSEMTNLIKSVGGGENQTETVKFLKKKVLEAAVKIEPQLQQIIQKATLKVLGCSEEQSYDGVNVDAFGQIPNLNSLPVSQSIFIPVQSIDILGNLKYDPNSKFGQVYYEKDNPSGDPAFIPYGGFLTFPTDKLLNELMTDSNQGRWMSEIIGRNYQGLSLNPLFDIKYTTQNEFGVSGNFFQVVLTNRTDDNGNIYNSVSTFITDYYKTIKISSWESISASLIQILTGSMSMTGKWGREELLNYNATQIIIQRILGLCYDSRSEIDVSGISKVAELDGVDDSFFELNEVDLRNIDVEISNIQNGVMEFVDCQNVKLPVDFENLTDQLIRFRDLSDGISDAEKVEEMSKITDSISQNPNWQELIPPDFLVTPAIDSNIISKIPVALVFSILTPKTLLPIFTLLAVTQGKATVTYNQAITSNNEIANPANNLSNQTNNLVSDAKDFMKKFRTFNIEVTREVSNIFLKELFEIFKRDIFALIQIVVKDINRSKVTKIYNIITRLLQFAVVISQLVQDLYKCKSLLDNIESILSLIARPPLSASRIPEPLLLFSPLLPGTSPERSTINSIQFLQSLGIDTGPNTDGSPNLMLQFLSSTVKGIDKEISENGKVQSFGISPLGKVEIFSKFF